MKTLFALCAMLVCGVVAAEETKSVLNHGTPTPAAPAVSAAPAAAPATGPALVALPKRSRCANGQCQLYSVEEQNRESTRNRVFGGQVIRRGNRTVLRPVR